MEAPRSNRQISPRRTAYVETYGCQMNVSDGELMQGILAGAGYGIAQRPEDADVILVNTCAIREHAEQRVLGRVGELNRIKTSRPDVVIGVTGCMAQRMGQTLLERAPYVDLVMGPDGYRGLPGVLARVRPALGAGSTDYGHGHVHGHVHGGASAGFAGDASTSVSSTDQGHGQVHGQVHGGASAGLAGDVSAGAASGRRVLPVLGVSAATPAAAEAASTRLAVLELTADENYEGLEVRRSSRVSAWVPVQRGCDHRCTFCIVPYVRGPEKNRDPQAVLDEVRGVAAQGITEVVLLGQTVNSYAAGGWSFARLVRAVAHVPGIRRVRFTSPHPNDVTPDLIDVMATEPAVCKQLHLPVQSGHDRTLKRMLRRYTVETYLDTVRQVRAAVPGIALSTDVIVGFPGETDEEYEATVDLLREVRYDDAFLYKYSPRDGTPATRLPADQFVAADVAQARLERIIDIQRAIQAEINRAEVLRVLEVLVERPAKSAGDMLGRTDGYKVVAFPGNDTLVGRYVHVRLTATTGATFQGERVDPGEARVA
jgi:tRNA-2-methylthio-N6-dimethylallyladenosine synthase